MDRVAFPSEERGDRSALPHRPPLVSSVVVTGLAQVLASAATFYKYWLVRWHWSVEDLSAYSQVMRVRGVLEWIVLLMLPVAITRQLATNRSERELEGQRLLVWTGVAMGAVLLAVTGSAMVALPRSAAKLLFGNAEMRLWVEPCAMLLFGFGACLLVSAVARGFMLFHFVNVLNLTFAALVPTLILLLGTGRDVRHLVTITGGVATGMAVLSLLLLVRQCGEVARPLWREAVTHWAVAKDLLQYGVPRLSTLGCIAVMNLALPWLISDAGERPLLAAVNGLYGVISATAILIAPLGLVLLPHLSQLLASGRTVRAGTLMSSLLQVTIVLGGAACLLALGALQPIMRGWLGPEIAAYTALVVASAVAMPGLLVLELLRGPLDAASHIPWNAVSYGAGAAVTITTFFATQSLAAAPLGQASAWALGAGYTVGALVAVSVARRLYGVELLVPALLPALVVFCVSAAIMLWEQTWAGVPVRVVSGVGLTVCYTAALLFGGRSWLTALLRTIRRRPGGAEGEAL